LIGVCGIVTGLLLLLWPGLSPHTLLYCIAVWTIVLGLCEIAGAVALHKVIASEWVYFLSGAVPIILGLVLMFRSGEGARALGGACRFWGSSMIGYNLMPFSWQARLTRRGTNFWP
jgi:uncharacterized membrane protein HdeD (DUF308 family)